MGVASFSMLVLLAGFSIAGCGNKSETANTSNSDKPIWATELAGISREPSLDVSELSLPNAVDGTAQVFKADPDGLLLLYFGYTSCPDVCPTTLSDFRVALEELPADEASRVDVAMATVDPDRDTGKLMSSYLDHFFEADQIHPLRTEDPEELSRVTQTLGVQFSVAEHAAGATEYDVSHSAITYVVDDQGLVRVEWPFGIDSQAMASDLHLLLSNYKEK